MTETELTRHLDSPHTFRELVIHKPGSYRIEVWRKLQQMIDDGRVRENYTTGLGWVYTRVTQ